MTAPAFLQALDQHRIFGCDIGRATADCLGVGSPATLNDS
jgi:hypothetical protein